MLYTAQHIGVGLVTARQSVCRHPYTLKHETCIVENNNNLSASVDPEFSQQPTAWYFCDIVLPDLAEPIAVPHRQDRQYI